jgi:acyl-CoA thioesterase FadM
MNLLFRLLRILLTAGLRARTGILDETSLFFRVWPTDLDPLWHVNNGKYGSLMDLGRLDMMIRSGVGRLIVSHGWHPVVAAQWLRFKISLTPFTRFELRSRTIGWDDRSFYVRQTFMIGDRIAAVGLIRARFLTKSGAPVNARDIVGQLAPTLQSPSLPDYVRDWQAAEEHLSRN